MDIDPRLGIPYLILLSVGTVTGTVGNIMIIGAVLINKVQLYKSFGIIPWLYLYATIREVYSTQTELKVLGFHLSGKNSK